MKVENGEGVWIYDDPITGPFGSATEKAVEEALAGLWTECNERGELQPPATENNTGLTAELIYSDPPAKPEGK